MKVIPRLIPGLAFATLHAEPVNLVKKGEEAYQLWGCATCHAVAKDDLSIKSGPSLYDLFQTEPRSREVLDPASGKTITVPADKAYFIDSVRNPGPRLAIHEIGPTKGEAYPPVMPQFTAEVVSDANLEAMWHYLRHAAAAGKNGPAVVMGEVKADAVRSDFDNPAAVLVDQRPRVIRAPLPGASARAIHVGLPNGMNYTFDPRQLSLRSVWSGGFLNLEKEQTGRSTPGSQRGQGARDVLDATPALVPLTADGSPVDFEFKEPDLDDDDAIIRHLEKGGDFLKELASRDAGFDGYHLTASGVPEFRFRVGKNSLRQQITFADDGSLVIEVSGTLATPQAFQLRTDGWSGLQAEGGTLADHRWTLPAGEGKTYRLRAGTGSPLGARAPLAVKENLAPQPATTRPASAELPAGYRIEDWAPPKDSFGREQLFEPTAMAVAKDGTLVVGTRTAGIWRWKDQTWQMFAEGTFECLGLVIEDDSASTIVITQKPELTRLRDLDGDGRADAFDTLCDDFGFHGNYHEYTHGPVRDAAGNYHFALNLSHGKNDRASYKAGGQFMGSMGGFRGWACLVTPDGVFKPYANGLRSPAGLATAPDGRIVYTENQGEYVGSSKISYLVDGAFYGHPSGLVSLPGMKPGSPEIAFDRWQAKTHPHALWFPHNKLANSPGNPAWDLSEGKFGPFAGQMFVGDQTLSTVMRVASEEVGGIDQGTMILFARNLASGIMRPCFLPDGSLLLGQTGRGWQAKGGKTASLQRILYDPAVTPADIHSMRTRRSGFTVRFTAPLAETVTPDSLRSQLRLDSWTYTDAVTYGSRENEKRTHVIAGITISGDRKSADLEVEGFGTPGPLPARIHHLQVKEAPALFPSTYPAWPMLEAYHTLNALPE